MKAPLPNDEIQRLEVLLQYKILDTPAEAAFDDLALIASYTCGTPIALVTLVDANRQWCKSKVGLEQIENPRDVAFCAHAILQPDVFIVPDMLADSRFATNPLVTSAPQFRFYAGVPLITSEGYALGTLCVIDYVPRKLEPQHLEVLRVLSNQAIAQLELRRHLTKRKQAEAKLCKALELEKELNELKSRFICMTSHEFRTPLTTILGSAELLKHYSNNWTDEKKLFYFNRIQDTVQHLNQVLDDVLLLGKLEVGKLESRPELLDVE